VAFSVAFRCSSDGFGGFSLLRRQFQWVFVSSARLFAGMEMAELVVSRQSLFRVFFGLGVCGFD
jgi:hypothetical protein